MAAVDFFSIRPVPTYDIDAARIATHNRIAPIQGYHTDTMGKYVCLYTSEKTCIYIFFFFLGILRLYDNPVSLKEMTSDFLQ